MRRNAAAADTAAAVAAAAAAAAMRMQRDARTHVCAVSCRCRMRDGGVAHADGERRMADGGRRAVKAVEAVGRVAVHATRAHVCACECVCACMCVCM